MNQKTINYNDEWNKIIKIHNETKILYILSEEYSNDLKMFIQPIKEMRDAYEHIVRAYSNIENKQYVKVNFDKALGHEYRAFFDTIDFLSINFRYKISEVLKSYSYEDIVSVYPEYEKISARLTEIPFEIAECRSKKDIGKCNDIFEIIEKYKKIVIDELLEYYKITVKDILPKLAAIH